VPDPKIPETHEVLLARARTLHPSDSIPDDAPSRFKKVEAAPAPAAADAPAAAAGAAPVAVAAVALAPRAAGPLRIVRPAGSGRVERPIASVVRTPPPMFAGELAGEFDEIMSGLGRPRRHAASLAGRIGLRLLGASQGLLGALPDGVKRRLQETVGDSRFFDEQRATAGNLLLNFLLYPILCVVIALGSPTDSVFDWGIRWWVALGFTIAVVEAMWRLRDNLFRGVPIGEASLGAALYGYPMALLPVVGIAQGLLGKRGVESGVGFDGFYAGDEHFDEKIERARRYGEVYKLEERDDAYVLRLEFPRVVPPTSQEMPDYEYDLAVHGQQFVVHGRLADPQIKKITGVAPAFPPDFTTRIPLGDRVAGFRHRLRGKTLEVILPKAVA
jgi:hypothetical protein